MDGESGERKRPRVVVVGAGFGGLEAAKALAREPVEVVVIDRRNHHLFQPLLYQVATAALNPADISAPVRAVLGRAGVEVVLGEVNGFDLGRHAVRIADGHEVPYHFLVVAAGATHSYFGREQEWAPWAPGLKTLEDALEIRRRILTAFERGERERDPGRLRALLTFVVIGGGPTGVELAGAIAEIARQTLAKDFRHVRPESARVVLVEAGPRLLQAFPEPLSAAARRQLERLGVEVRLDAPVTGVDAEGVVAGGERIPARTVLWGAGVAANPIGKALGAPLDRAGRVIVREDLSLPDHPEVFVVGDLATVRQGNGEPVPGIAPAALQMGRHAARSIVRSLRGEPPRPFRYRDKGLLATIGRAAAVARVGRLRFSGLLAWLLWLFVHVWFLIGFRNRVAVMLQWAWSYLTFKRGARLIIDTAGQARFEASRGGPPPPDAA